MSYKDEDFEKQLSDACPDGVDVYFENVGGRVLDAVIPLLNRGAQIPISGYISLYNEDRTTRAPTPIDVLAALDSPIEHRFFLVDEWREESQTAADQLVDWVKADRIRYRETIAEGLATAPEAFIGLLEGKNLGKQLVKLS